MKNEVSEIHKMIYSLFYSHERLPQLKYFKKLFDIVSIVSIVPRVRTIKFNQWFALQFNRLVSMWCEYRSLMGKLQILSKLTKAVILHPISKT